MRARTISVYERATGKHYGIQVAKNQKVVQIHRVKNGINFAASYQSLKDLTANAHLLYMYLLLHSEGRVWALSSKDVYERTHLTDKTYPKAVQELIEKKYLTPGDIDIGTDAPFTENAYHFWETPSLNPHALNPQNSTSEDDFPF